MQDPVTVEVVQELAQLIIDTWEFFVGGILLLSVFLWLVLGGE